MTRILFVGDLAPTGFGTVTMDLGRALLDRGEDVRFVSMNESGDTPPEPFGSRTAIVGQPSGWLGFEDEAACNERLERMFTGGIFEDGWTPEAAILLGDPASLLWSPVMGFLPDGFPAFHYVPIEGVGLPPRWLALWPKAQPVAMCEFGADEIAKLGLSRPPVVYHGIDTSVFHAPTPKRPLTRRTDKGLDIARSRSDARRILGWPDDALILFRADRFMPRKMMAAMVRGVAPVLARHPNAYLVLHMLVRDQGGDINDILSHFPAEIRTRINVTNAGGALDRQTLAFFYAAADLYLNTGAEGFGLCIAESLACGTPALGLEYSSVPEVIGPAGATVPVAQLVDNVYGYYWAAPDARAYAVALDQLVSDKARLRLLGAKGPYHVEKFSWAKAAEQFSALIEAAVPQEVAA